MMKYFIAVFLIFLFHPGYSQELIVNGDFELDLATGWTLDSLLGMTVGYDTIDRNVGFHPDGDYELRVKKYDSYFIRLSQTIDIPSTNLDFSCSAKLYAREYNPGGSAWAAASIVLSYLNSANVQLGETRICNKSAHSPWTNTNTEHFIVVTDTAWCDYSFNIDDELANLPGVNPSDIAKIRIAASDTSDGC